MDSARGRYRSEVLCQVWCLVDGSTDLRDGHLRPRTVPRYSLYNSPTSNCFCFHLFEFLSSNILRPARCYCAIAEVLILFTKVTGCVYCGLCTILAVFQVGVVVKSSTRSIGAIECPSRGTIGWKHPTPSMKSCWSAGTRDQIIDQPLNTCTISSTIISYRRSLTTGIPMHSRQTSCYTYPATDICASYLLERLLSATAAHAS